MCASKMMAVAFAALGACSSAMRVRKGASMSGVKAGEDEAVMPVLESDFNPIGEGTIPGAHGFLVMVFGDGDGINVEDLRDISLSKRFPAGYTYNGEIHGQRSVPERQRNNWLSSEQREADSPHPGSNGFVEATMENINFIICPFIGTLVNEGALPLQQVYTRDELQEVTRIAGLDPAQGVPHVDGNFLHDPDGVQDVWNMEGFTNEHVSSTGIHDCITQFRFCHHEHPPSAICQTETHRDCRHPNRFRFEQFVDAVDANNDNIITITELDRAGEVAEEHGIPINPKHEEACFQGTLNSLGNICCGACGGLCGGSGCGSRPGGASQCCAGRIRDSGKVCENGADTACIVDSS